MTSEGYMVSVIVHDVDGSGRFRECQFSIRLTDRKQSAAVLHGVRVPDSGILSDRWGKPMARHLRSMPAVTIAVFHHHTLYLCCGGDAPLTDDELIGWMERLVPRQELKVEVRRPGQEPRIVHHPAHTPR